MQGVVQEVRLLWTQQALSLGKPLVFYLEKYNACHSFLPESPRRHPDPSSSTLLCVFSPSTQLLMLDCVFHVFVNSCGHLKVKNLRFI